MEKIKFKKGNNYCDIDIEYDEKRYNVEYVQEEGVILLRRLSDNKVIKIFSDNIGFLVQVDKDNKTHFLVSNYKTDNEEIKLKHYIDYKYDNKLKLVKEFDNSYVSLSEIRLSDSSFIIEKNHYSASIYNLENRSRRFDRIYNDEKVRTLFNASDNTIMVSRLETADFNHKINDMLTFGINPETYEITTPIWSEDQQRFISIYTEEQLDEIEKILLAKGKFLNRKISAAEITIALEITHYLNIRDQYTDKPKSIYVDGQTIDKKINEEFVRSFIKK